MCVGFECVMNDDDNHLMEGMDIISLNRESENRERDL